MFAYAVLAVSAIVAVKGLWLYYFEKQALSLSRFLPVLGPETDADGKVVPWSMQLADNLVTSALDFLPWDCFSGALGQRSLGSLLDVGSQGNMGFPHLIMYLAYVHYRHSSSAAGCRSALGAVYGLHRADDLLVWGELPAFSGNSVHTYTG